MKPILVIVHIYYPDLWEELKTSLKNITLPYDLYVTTVVENKFLKKDVLSFNSKAHFEVVENRGYDVGPFLHILNQINLDNYSYLIKLHTKRNVSQNGPLFRELRKSQWREKLLKILQTPQHFNICLKFFEKNKHLGMIADYHVIVRRDFYDKQARLNIKKWLKEHCLKPMSYSFVAGTMFLSKAFLFKDIQNLHICLSDFPTSDKNHISQLAHIFERLFGYVIYKNGFILADPFVSEKKQNKYDFKIYIMGKFVNPFVRLFFQNKRTKSGKHVIKICKIPVYQKKI